jgi:uncharacterized protein
MRASLLLFVLALGTTAFAQDTIDPAKRASIEELLSLMRVDKTLEQMLPQAQRMIAQAMESSLPGEIRDSQDKAKAVAELQKRVFDLMKEKITYANMKPDYVRLYDETFSAGEIAGILAFYKTPPGRAYLEKLPLLSTKSIELAQRMMTNLIPEVQKVTAAWAEEMKQKYGKSGDAK